MKEPSEILDALARRLDLRWRDRSAPVDAGWPHSIVLGAPPRADLERDFPRAREWALGWSRWADTRPVELVWAARNVRGTTQRIPTHVTIADAETAAHLVGHGWPERLRTARARQSNLEEQFPTADTTRAVRACADMSDVDFDLCCRAAHWFATHPVDGLTPRQVPIEGLHSKWLNTNRQLVADLAGLPTLPLVDRPVSLLITYLDPGHLASGGRHHDILTAGDVTTPAYLPGVVLLVENKDSAMFFPPVPDAIAIHSSGFAGAPLLADTDWIRNSPRILYWGDIDPAGFEIVNQIRRRGLNVATFLMDPDTYTHYERYGAWTDTAGRPLPCPPRKTLDLLTDREAALYRDLTEPTWARTRRVEQERIPLERAAAQLQDLRASYQSAHGRSD